MKLYDENGQRIYLVTSAEVNTLREVAQLLADELANSDDPDTLGNISQAESTLAGIIQAVEGRA